MDDETRNRLVEAVPEYVIEAVADAVSPVEIGGPSSATSELVHRTMAVTYDAVRLELERLRAVAEQARLAIKSGGFPELTDALAALDAVPTAETTSGIPDAATHGTWGACPPLEDLIDTGETTSGEA